MYVRFYLGERASLRMCVCVCMRKREGKKGSRFIVLLLEGYREGNIPELASRCLLFAFCMAFD